MQKKKNSVGITRTYYKQIYRIAIQNIRLGKWSRRIGIILIILGVIAAIIVLISEGQRNDMLLGIIAPWLIASGIGLYLYSFYLVSRGCLLITQLETSINTIAWLTPEEKRAISKMSELSINE